MHVDQRPYVALYKAICGYSGSDPWRDVIEPWLRDSPAERSWLAALRDRLADPPEPLGIEASWRLYALSRVLDLLQMSISAPPEGEPGWRIAPVTREQHERFIGALGLEPLSHPHFHPFFHEIVTVDQSADSSALPEIVDEVWAGARLGPLVICRAGCRISSGRDHVVKGIAETSTLYWAHARSSRPTADLGDGWGSNSQWRTAFRQDHEVSGRLYYNVGASDDERDDLDPDLTADEKRELLRHRCFVRCDKPSDDRWPYDDQLVEDLG